MNQPQLRVASALDAFMSGLPQGSPRPNPPVLQPVPDNALRLWIGPLALMLFTPWIVVALWMAVRYYDGSLLAFAQGYATWRQHVPSPTLLAVAQIVGWTAFQGVLLSVLPGEKFLGPPTPAGEQPEYKLNGIAAWFISHGVVVGAWYAGLFSAWSFYEGYGDIILTCTLGALAFCAFLYWKGHRWPSSRDTVWTGRPVFDFFQGIELHPRLAGVSLKQLINCRVSMMGWSVIAVVFALAQYEHDQHVSTGMVAAVTVLVVYLFKFFWWESGYFGSLDIMHDRFGYYICWGVLAWVPATYEAPFLWLVERPVEWSVPAAVAIVVAGCLSIWINYDADAQRQRVRATKGNTTVWGKPPETMTAAYTTADGEQRTSILLLSGWWGVARHFHYIPELGLAFAWTVPAGFTHFLPWFYWVFLAILLFDRAGRDEKRCAAKYGPAWELYKARVKWRIVPGVY